MEKKKTHIFIFFIESAPTLEVRISSPQVAFLLLNLHFVLCGSFCSPYLYRFPKRASAVGPGVL